MVGDKDLTSKNLDFLADFLNYEIETPHLAVQIPDEAEIFHGSYQDPDLTQTNLKRATRMLVEAIQAQNQQHFTVTLNALTEA